MRATSILSFLDELVKELKPESRARARREGPVDPAWFYEHVGPKLALENLWRFTGVETLDAITPTLVRRWFEDLAHGPHRRRRPADLEKLRRHLRTACDIAVARGYLTRNPVPRRLAHVAAGGVDRREIVVRKRKPKKAPSFHEFATEYLGAAEARGLGRESLSAMRCALAAFKRSIRPGSVRDLTPKAVAKWRDGMMARGLEMATIHDRLRRLSSACIYAVEAGYLESNPVGRTPVLAGRPGDLVPQEYRERCAKRRRRRALRFTQADMERVLAELRRRTTTWEGRRLYVLVATIAATGLSPGEALRLEKAGFVPWSGRLLIAGRIEPIILSEDLNHILSLWIELSGDVAWQACPWAFPGVDLEGPWTGGGKGGRALDQLKDAGRAAGIKNLNFRMINDLTNTLLEWNASNAFANAMMSLSAEGHEPHPPRSIDLAPGVERTEGWMPFLPLETLRLSRLRLSPPPAQDDVRPDVGRGEIAPALVPDAERRTVVIRGREKTVSPAQFDALAALYMAGPDGLDEERWKAASGREGCRVLIHALRRSDRDFAWAIIFPGSPRGGTYRIRTLPNRD
jgi:integrase